MTYPSKTIPIMVSVKPGPEEDFWLVVVNDVHVASIYRFDEPFGPFGCDAGPWDPAYVAVFLPLDRDFIESPMWSGDLHDNGERAFNAICEILAQP